MSGNRMTRNSPDLRPIREPVPLPEPGSDVGSALRNLMQTFRQCVDSAIRDAGLDVSFAHGMVLKNLAKQPGLSGAQLARRAMVAAQSMNSLLRGMESTGMIVREKHPENRRIDCWFMTRAGYRQMERAGEIIEGIMARMLASLPKGDARRLSELLQDCAAALQSGADLAAEAPRRGRAAVSGSSRTARN
jgi:DNA-binding MarR family transcriptional regulator